MEGLDFSTIPFDLIVNIANIVVFYLIVRHLVYKPVKRFLTAREERLTQIRHEARQIKEEAEALRQQYEEKLREGDAAYQDMVLKGEQTAQEKAAKILQAAHAREHEADAKAILILEDAQTEAQTIRNDAMEKAAKEQQAILQNAKEEVVELSLQIASRLIERNIDDRDNRNLADALFSEACHEMSAGKNGKEKNKEGGRA